MKQTHLRGLLYLPSAAHYRREALRARVEELANSCHNPGGSGAGGEFCGEKSGSNKAIGPNGEVNGITRIGKVGIKDWQANHGISQEVMASRGYQHYEKTSETPDGEIDPKIDQYYGSDNGTMTQMRNASAQSSGIIMPRHAVPGSPTNAKKPILPQTRPDSPVLASEEVQELRRQGISLDDLEADPNLKDRVINGYKGKDGVEVPGLGAKYLFPAGKGNAARVDLPPGPDGENERRFLSGKGPVYLAMEGSIKTDAVLTAIRAGQGGENASVIGVPSVTLWHTPEMSWVAGKFLKGREVVLIPDADGVTNRNVRNQARALQNLLEISGAGKVRAAAPPLTKDGHIVEVKLPSGGKEKLKGVDDYLGAGKGNLEKLDTVDRVAPKIDLGKYKVLAKSTGIGDPKVWESMRSDTKASVEDTLRAVSLLADPKTGELRAGGRTIAAAIGGHLATAQNSLDRLVALGILKKENISEMSKARKAELIEHGVLDSTPSAPSYYYGGRKITVRSPDPVDSSIGRGSSVDDDLITSDERNPEIPVYTITDKRFRAVDVPVSPLGDAGRNVSSAAGEAFYGVPKGTALTSDIISQAIKNARGGGE